jgi:hypothetical protein
MVRRTGRQDGPGAAAPDEAGEDPMVIDCDSCTVRGPACGDCLVTAVVEGPPRGAEFTPTELAAIRALVDAGLLPRLRYRPAPAVRRAA